MMVAADSSPQPLDMLYGADMGPAVGERRLRLDLERDPQAPSVARAAVRGFAEGSDIGASELSTVALLVSELVSNAVIHSDAPPGSAILLCARLFDSNRVRIEVIDQGSGFTATPRAPAGPAGGYGLYLVSRQATRWGVDREGGTRAWFELDAPRRRER